MVGILKTVTAILGIIDAQLRVSYHEFYEFTNFTNLRVDHMMSISKCQHLNSTIKFNHLLLLHFPI